MLTVSIDKEKERLYIKKNGRVIRFITSYNFHDIIPYLRKIENIETLVEHLGMFYDIYHDEKYLYLKCPYDKDFVDKLKKNGAVWDSERKLWKLPKDVIDPLIGDEIVSYMKIIKEKAKRIIDGIIRENYIIGLKSRSSKEEKLIEIKIPKGKRLYPFQKAGVEYAIKKEGKVLFGDEMGLGKTIQAIVFFNTIEKEEAFPLLVVCPSNMRYKWEDKFKEWSIHNPKIVHIKGKKGEIDNGDVYIINYDIIADRLEQIMSIKPKSIIIDEAHYVKNPWAKRTKAVFKIAKECRYRIALTGTPVMNDISEIYTIGKIIRPDIFRSYKAFEDKYKDNLKLLNNFLRRTIMIRRLKEDVLKELPEKVRIPLRVDVNMDKVKEVEEEFKNKINALKEKGYDPFEDTEDFFRVILPLFDKMRQITGLLKIESLIPLIEDVISEKRKAVIFAHHKDVIKGVSLALDKLNIKHEVITGDTSQEKKYLIAKKFNEDKETKVIVASILATAEGIDLTAADTVFFLQIDWTPAKNLQAEDRVHRIGQEKRVFSYWLIAKNTIDEHIVKKVIEKIKLIEGAIGIKEDTKKLEEFSNKWTYILREIIEEIFHG